MTFGGFKKINDIGPLYHMSKPPFDHGMSVIKFFDVIGHEFDSVQLLARLGRLGQEKPVGSIGS